VIERTNLLTERNDGTICTMRRTTIVLVFLVVCCDLLRSPTSTLFLSRVFLQEAITAVDAIDMAYKSVLNHDPDAVYAPLRENFQRSLALLKAKASEDEKRTF
jgi:hypothetical protein